MKSKHIKEIKIGYSCNEEWSKMNGTKQKRHCESCSKSVFNFSYSSNEEILKFLTERNGQKICGKFDINQLVELNQSIRRSNEISFYKPLIIGTSLATMISCGTSKEACDANHVHEKSRFEIISNINNPDSINTVLIKGQIFDDENYPLIGANFVFNESKLGTTTDIDGIFEIEVNSTELISQTASVQYVGYETLEIPLVDIKNKEVKISMIDMGHLLGDVVIIRQPLHKRMWNGFINIFR